MSEGEKKIQMLLCIVQNIEQHGLSVLFFSTCPFVTANESLEMARFGLERQDVCRGLNLLRMSQQLLENAKVCKV